MVFTPCATAGAERYPGRRRQPSSGAVDHSGGHLAQSSCLSGYGSDPGSVAGQLAPAGRGWFAGGTISASLVWFYGLALIAVRLAPWLIQSRVQRAIQWLVGIVMWCVALQLLHQGWRMFRALAAF